MWFLPSCVIFQFNALNGVYQSAFKNIYLRYMNNQVCGFNKNHLLRIYLLVQPIPIIKNEFFSERTTVDIRGLEGQV